MRKLINAATSRVSLITYLTGTVLISVGAALVYAPAGLVAAGVLLIVLVIDGGRP